MYDFSEIIDNKSLCSDMISFDPIPKQEIRNHGNFPKGTELDLGAMLSENGDLFFRFFAPNATSVKIDVSDLARNEFEAEQNFDPEILQARRMPKNGKIIELEKQENGSFEGVLPYSKYASGMRVMDVYVDDTLVLDPYMPITYIHDRYSNYVEIPDPGMDEMLVKDVPHGTVCTDIYYSKVMNQWVRQLVYMPPDYEKDDRTYPVIYLHQGRSQLETAWVSDGKLPQIMDNLIAENRAKPCIIVMNNGMLRTPEDEVEKYDGFIRMICEDTIPFNESKYRIKADKWNRALAGLSMGGMQATQGGLTHPELFAWLGWFSCSIRMRDVELDFDKSDYLDILRNRPEEAAREYKLIYKSNGISELNRDKIVYNEIAWITEHGIDKIPCYKREVLYDNGGEHEWNTWRRSLVRFAELVFKD